MIAYSISSNVATGNMPPTGIPPGGTISNVLQGTPFDLVTEDGIFSLYLNQEPQALSTTNPQGTPSGALTHTLYMVEQGVQKTIIPTSGIFTGPDTAGSGALHVNENLVMRFRVRAGARLGHQITNTSTTVPGWFNAHYVIE